MVQHHRDAVVWDADQGQYVNSSSTTGSGKPLGIGVTDVSGAANLSLLFPGQTIRDNVLGRIGTLVSVSTFPTGAAGGEVSPATIGSVVFNAGHPAEQTALLITTARYPGHSAAAFLIFSDSTDGITQAATHYGALTDGTAYGATYAFNTGHGTTVTGIVDGTTITGAQITGAQIIADGSSGEFLVYSGTPAAGNLIASVSGAAGTDAHGNAYLSGHVTYLAGTTALQADSGGMSWYSAPGHAGPWTLGAQVTANVGGGINDIGITADGVLFQGSSSADAAVDVTGGISVTGGGGQLLVLHSLSTPGTPIFQIEANSAGDEAFGISNLAEANDRLIIDSTGKINWGNGSAGVDTNLYRAGANSLQTDDNFTTGGTFTADGIAALTAGSDTSAGVTVRTPGLANGTPGQLGDTTRDYMVYLQVGTPGTAFSLKIGAGNPPGNTIYASATPPAGLFLSFRLPAGWWIQWGGTGTTLASQRAVSC